MRERMPRHHEASIVTIEFANEIPARTFNDILPDELSGRRIRIDPLEFPSLADAVPALRDQVRHWADHIGTGPPPAAVLAYCSAARLAADLVSAMDTPGITLALFDPVFPGPQAPQELLLELGCSMDSSLDPQDVPDIRGLPATEALARASCFLRSVVARCASDLDEVVADEFTAEQRAWLSFLLSTTTDRTLPALPGHVFLSAEADWAADDTVAIHRTGLSAMDLFTSSSVKPALTQILVAR